MEKEAYSFDDLKNYAQSLSDSTRPYLQIGKLTRPYIQQAIDFVTPYQDRSSEMIEAGLKRIQAPQSWVQKVPSYLEGAVNGAVRFGKGLPGDIASGYHAAVDYVRNYNKPSRFLKDWVPNEHSAQGYANYARLLERYGHKKEGSFDMRKQAGTLDDIQDYIGGALRSTGRGISNAAGAVGDAGNYLLQAIGIKDKPAHGPGFVNAVGKKVRGIADKANETSNYITFGVMAPNGPLPKLPDDLSKAHEIAKNFAGQGITDTYYLTKYLRSPDVPDLAKAMVLDGAVGTAAGNVTDAYNQGAYIPPSVLQDLVAHNTAMDNEQE